jgi:hypothetical protein
LKNPEAQESRNREVVVIQEWEGKEIREILISKIKPGESLRG